MDQRHKDYIDYYAVRFKKYEGSAIYKNTYKTEKALYEGIKSSATLEEFGEKEKKEELTLKNAKALTKDQATYRLQVFRELEEKIRAQGPDTIVQKVDSFKDVMELATRVSEIMHRNSIEISVDLLTGNFYSDFIALENIEVWEKAEVPARWKGRLKKFIDDQIEGMKKVWREVRIPRAREWDPKWKMDYENVWESRHRRLIPMKDTTVKRRIEEHKKYFAV